MAITRFCRARQVVLLATPHLIVYTRSLSCLLQLSTVCTKVLNVSSSRLGKRHIIDELFVGSVGFSKEITLRLFDLRNR